jgi:hypothetical protein
MSFVTGNMLHVTSQPCQGSATQRADDAALLLLLVPWSAGADLLLLVLSMACANAANVSDTTNTTSSPGNGTTSAPVADTTSSAGNSGNGGQPSKVVKLQGLGATHPGPLPVGSQDYSQQTGQQRC